MLGKGFHGKVFLCRLKDSEELLAMKVIRKDRMIQKKQLEHTIAEKLVMEHMEHPYIVGLRHCF